MNLVTSVCGGLDMIASHDIIMIVITVITLTGAVRDFLQSPQTDCDYL